MAALFLGNEGDKTKGRKTKSSGHDPEMLLPLLGQVNEMALRGHSMTARRKTFSFRAWVASSPLDFKEIPYLFLNKACTSYDLCITCDFQGRTGFNNGKRAHFFPYKRNGELTGSNWIIPETYIEMINGRRVGSFPPGRPSVWVTQLPSHFPPLIAFTEPCHTLGLGAFKWLLEITEAYFPRQYKAIKHISAFTFVPRSDSQPNVNLFNKSSWKSRHYYFFGRVLLLPWTAEAGFGEEDQVVRESFVLFHEIFSAACSKSKSVKINVDKSCEMEKKFLEFCKMIGSKISHAEFVPNLHRIVHLFMQMMLGGRPHNFSMFGMESANSIVSEGVSGTKNPLNSIIRFQDRLLHIENCKSFLLQSEFFAANFPCTRRLLFPSLYRKENRNWMEMIKVYKPGSLEVKFYLEVMKDTPNAEQTSNAVISYTSQGRMFGGIIREIRKGFLLEDVLPGGEELSAEDSSLNISEEEENENLWRETVTREVSSQPSTRSHLEGAGFHLVVDRFELLSVRHFQDRRLWWLRDCQRREDITVDQVLQVFGYCQTKNYFLVFQVDF